MEQHNMTESVKDLMKTDAKRPPSGDRLVKVKKKIADLRALEFENASLSERMKENSTKIYEMKNKELVDLFDEVGINSLGIDGDGNLPPYDIEIKPYYKANIPEENETEAFQWLRKNKHGDMIKATYTVTFGMGEEKAKKAFETILKKGKYSYSYKFGVPWNTLTAFVKEQIENYKREPPLKLLGATVGRVASLKKPPKSTEKKGSK